MTPLSHSGVSTSAGFRHLVAKGGFRFRTIESPPASGLRGPSHQNLLRTAPDRLTNARGA
jgi:hypothetical protein